MMWWCPTCKKNIDGEEVTYEETHDERCGGCGQKVVPEEPDKRPLGLEYYSEVVAFARHLVEEKDWTAKELLGFLEKPRKWEGEYKEWREKETEPTECETECARGGPENCNGCMD